MAQRKSGNTDERPPIEWIAVLLSLIFHAALFCIFVVFPRTPIVSPRESDKTMDIIVIPEKMLNFLFSPGVPPSGSPLGLPGAGHGARSPVASSTNQSVSSSGQELAAAPEKMPPGANSSGQESATAPEKMAPGDPPSGSPLGLPGANEGDGSPVASGGLVSSDEAEYLPQFKLTDVPIVPLDDVRARVVYPPLAAKQGIEATVYLELFIDRNGNIVRINVLKDPGYGFALAAINALSGLVCRPGMINNRPVPVRFRVPVHFVLK